MRRRRRCIPGPAIKTMPDSGRRVESASSWYARKGLVPSAEGTCSSSSSWITSLTISLCQVNIQYLSVLIRLIRIPSVATAQILCTVSSLVTGCDDDGRLIAIAVSPAIYSDGKNIFVILRRIPLLSMYMTSPSEGCWVRGSGMMRPRPTWQASMADVGGININSEVKYLVPYYREGQRCLS